MLHYFLPPPSFSPPSLFPLIRNNVSIFQQTVRLYLVVIPIQRTALSTVLRVPSRQKGFDYIRSSKFAG